MNKPDDSHLLEIPATEPMSGAGTENYGEGYSDIPKPELETNIHERSRFAHLNNQRRSAAYAIKRFGIEHPRAL